MTESLARHVRDYESQMGQTEVEKIILDLIKFAFERGFDEGVKSVGELGLSQDQIKNLFSEVQTNSLW
jgi:hypothetical protein